jgi:hypothetical protein
LRAHSDGFDRPLLSEREMVLPASADGPRRRPVKLFDCPSSGIEVQMSTDALSTPERKPSGWRMSFALALWVGGFFLPLLIPFVTALPVPVATRTALSGLLLLGLRPPSRSRAVPLDADRRTSVSEKREWPERVAM